MKSAMVAVMAMVWYLSAGMVESLLSHMDFIHGKLNFLTTHKLGALSEVSSPIYPYCYMILIREN